MLKALWIAPLILVLAFPTSAAELGGVQMDDTVRVGNDTLVLNGLGLRKKAIFKVYVGGLYLTSREGDSGKILAADAPRRMVMEFVRNVGKGSIVGAWDDCLEANAVSGVAGDFDRLSGWMDDVGSGDRLVFTYLPAKGTEVEVKGSVRGTIAGKPFADALYACWIGDHPPSEDFRAGLLGG